MFGIVWESKRLANRFIVFEGPNSCGKSTLIAAVSKALALRQVGHKTLKFPSPSSIGKLCREYAISADQPYTLTCLVAAEFHRSAAEDIEPALSLGSYVLCDRYVMSSYVYQGMQGVADLFVDGISSFLVQPSIYFVLRASEQTIRRRRPGVTDNFEKLENIADELRRYEVASDMMRKNNIRVETLDAEQSTEKQAAIVLENIL